MRGFFDLAIGTLGAATPGPADDFWYNPAGQMTASGITLTPEGAQKVSAFYRGVDLLSTALAMLPLPIYKRLPNDDGADPAKDHPLYDVLHRKPNGWQDTFQWRRLMMRHLILRGNGYNRILPGARGFADQLWPMSPDRMKPELLDSGRIVYRYRDKKTGQVTTYTQDEIFHLRGVSDDGVEGVGVVTWARDSLGLALATESYASKLFSQGALYGTVFSVPQKPDPETEAAIQWSVQQYHGLEHAHKAIIGWSGAKVEKVALTGEESQFINSRKFSIDDIARWLGLPPHMIGSLDRSTNNNIEQQGQEFVTYSLGPWLTLFEMAINDQLILRPDAYFAEFTRDALVRGDIANRWQAYQVAVSTGTFTRNEIRRLENRKKLPGLDEPLDPAYLAGKRAGALPPAFSDRKKPAPANSADDSEDQARAIVVEAAARVLRKEVKVVQKLAVKWAADGERFAEAIADFYAAHVALVVDALKMPEAEASAYCAGQAKQAIDHGALVLETWTSPNYAEGLASWALEEAA